MSYRAKRITLIALAAFVVAAGVVGGLVATSGPAVAVAAARIAPHAAVAPRSSRRASATCAIASSRAYPWRG